MKFLSCLGVGLVFLIAVALLVFAGVMLGWVLPTAIARSRGGMPELRAPWRPEPPKSDEKDESRIDPSGPEA